jgi:hypothetical protein
MEGKYAENFKLIAGRRHFNHYKGARNHCINEMVHAMSYMKFSTKMGAQ